MIFKRNTYLNKLIESQGNGMVKIVTGGRRCGKSFLLFELFHQYLVGQGVAEDHIIEVSLDDRHSRNLRNPDVLLDYIANHKQKDKKTHYVILDEVQLVEDFVEVLLSLMHDPQLDVFVSGSNSKFLSKDVVTEFRGRGDEIRVWPLSFSEFCEKYSNDKQQAWRDYYTFGGLPQVALTESREKKLEYLHNLYELTYFRDVIERHHLRNEEGLRQLIQVLASGIGSSTNPKRISNTFKTVENVSISHNTIKDYIGFLEDSFLVEEALRYNVKGRKYIGAETKYYFSDLGLRNARINFRQYEETHLMENMIYNELRLRGMSVDVGVVVVNTKDENGVSQRKQLEVDFVCNQGSQRFYIQSALRLPTERKREQELGSLKHIGDNFRKFVITEDLISHYQDDSGITFMNIYEFLLNPNSISI